MKRNYSLLIGSVILDLVGMSSSLIGGLVGLSELSDLFIAPITFFWITRILKARTGLGILGFIEEILPFTDFIPSCTIAWFMG